MEAEFVKGAINNRYPAYMHIFCFAVSPVAKKKGFARWKSYMMNNFFRDVRCSHCNELLQCKCSIYKVSEAITGECKHG